MPETDDSAAKLAASIEAVLFTYGEPTTVTRIAKILSEGHGKEIGDADVRTALGILRDRLSAGGSGLSLIFQGEEVQLVTRPDLGMLVQAIAKEEFTEALTPAALETLAIIVYSGEVPRSTIDYIRGVNSSFIVRNLLVRGFIDRIPDPKRGNAYRYRPSFAALRHIGIEKAEALPEYAKFHEILGKFSPQPGPHDTV